MPTEKIYKVFVSSTYEDLREERSAVQRALLLVDCLPVGMELFPAADDDTWSFIQSQIDDSDYYVVLIAGRYGSLSTDDGLSYTEKEYDYAVACKKPVIGFVHGAPSNIPVGKTEATEEGRKQLEDFLSKVRRRPVRHFTTPHELALEVTTSFIRLMKERPAVGYVRSSDAVDYKRYAELLEENARLKAQVALADRATSVFAGHAKRMNLALLMPAGRLEFECSLGEAFQAVGEVCLDVPASYWVPQQSFEILLGDKMDKSINYRVDEELWSLLKREMLFYDLIEIFAQDHTSFERTTTDYHWRLTSYGKEQLRLLAARGTIRVDSVRTAP